LRGKYRDKVSHCFERDFMLYNGIKFPRRGDEDFLSARKRLKRPSKHSEYAQGGIIMS